MDRPPKMTVKLSQERKVRSFAKNTLGSTLVGRAIRFPGALWSKGWEDMLMVAGMRKFGERDQRVWRARAAERVAF